MTYKIGFSQTSFSPPVGKTMGGYSPLRNATGTADSLYAKTVCFAQLEKREAIIFTVLDLVAVDHLLKEAVLTKIHPLLPDWKLSLFLLATHTHSGPSGTLETRRGPKSGLTFLFGATDEEVISLCAEAGADSIRQSMKNLEGFVYGRSSVTLSGVGADRNDRAKEGDNQLTLLSFTTQSDRRLLLWHFSCHPTILKGENTLYSADLPGSVAAQLTEFDCVLFVNGNCGNISTRFTRQGDTFEEVERFGATIATAIRAALPAEAKELREIRISQYETPLLPNPRSILWGRQDSIPVRCSLLDVDGQRIVLAPAELTSDLTKSLREQHGMLFFCYCDDYLFYFADKACFRADTYEAKSSLVAEGEAERLMEELARRWET